MPIDRGRLLVAVCITLAATPAQSARWSLAADAIARYQQTGDVTVAPAAAKVDFTGPDNPPLLFGRELKRDGSGLAAAPDDLRELARWVAFDLTRAGRRARREIVAPAVVPYGDVHLRVRQGDADGDGWQHIECQLAVSPPEPRSDNRQLHLLRLLPRCTGSLEGSLVVDRRFDAERGMVTEWRAELAVALTAKAETAPVRLVRTEAWKLTDVTVGRSRDLEQRVADAIGRARGWLLRAVAEPSAGDLKDLIVRGSETRNSGRLALVLLALVHAEVADDDPVLQAGYAALRRRDVRDTYSLAAAILAIEAVHAPRHERRAILEGLQPGPRQRELPAADLALVQEWSERLLSNADPRVDAGRELRFSYTRRDDYDNSNTHFAALGLHAALLCGARVPETAFAACARHFLADQERAEGRPQPLRLTLLGKDGEPDDGATAAARPQRPAGWPYRSGEEATGSMTAAAVASLVLCRAALLRSGARGERKLLNEIDAAVGSGLAWLAGTWTLLGNPTSLRVEREWRAYHLYAVERACEYQRIALLGGIDWYRDGAEWLLAVQDEDGHFPGWGYEDTTAATCFGLLFLKKAALPVHTR